MSDVNNHEFNFPFQPYNIQQDFMSALYQTLEKGQHGIFESPTGTVSKTYPYAQLSHVFLFNQKITLFPN